MTDHDDADMDPASRLDAMERRVFGATVDRDRSPDATAGEDTDPDEGPGSAFEIDLEPEDQGTAGAAIEEPG